MDTGFANGHVVRDSHTAQGSISPLCDIYIVPSVMISRGGDERYHQGRDNGTGVDISVHINSLNGGSIVTKPLTHNIVLL
jgi:hypothetical protein